MVNAKVSIVRCETYQSSLVEKAVRRAIDLVGGINQFVNRGERVLVKPNVLSARAPEDAVCTHPEVVRAVIRILKERGASVTVGDSPGGFLKNIEEVYRISGIGKVALEEKVNLVKFTFSRTIDGFPISIRALSADKIISVPKFKTHEITGLTGAIKNMYGTIVGLHKTKCHADAPTEQSLAKIIARVYSIVKPNLTIMDGIVSMEGEGPSAGDPRKTKFVMASADGVAMDSALSVLAGGRPSDYAVIKEARNLGLGQNSIEKIDIVGDNFKDFVMTDFKPARGRFVLKFMPGFITNFIASQLHFYPEIDSKTCKKCNMCKSSCPVRAVHIVKGVYIVNKHKCIRCMCCREVCPYKAIFIKKNWLSRILWE